MFLDKKMKDVYGWAIEENGEQCGGARFVVSILKLKSGGKENYRITLS